MAHLSYFTTLFENLKFKYVSLKSNNGCFESLALVKDINFFGTNRLY